MGRCTRGVVTLALALQLALASTVDPHAAYAQPAGTGSLAIIHVDTSRYPTIALEVALPADAALEDVRFTVAENGEPAEVLAATSSADRPEREPVRAILVLDTSGSMAGRALDDAKLAARAFVEAMRPEDAVALVAFADEARTVSGFTADRGRLVALISGLRASGETALYDALGAASRLAGFADGGRAVIVLLSDGGDTVSASSLDSAAKSLAAARAPVYAVALKTREWNPEALASVVRATGGRLLETADSGELVEIYEGLASEVTNMCAVTFTSLKPPTKDLEIRVQATSGGTTWSGSAVVPNPLYAGPPPPDPGVLPGRAQPLLLVLAALAVFASVSLSATVLASWLTPQRARLDRLAFYDQASEEIARRSGTTTGFQARLVDVISQLASRRGFTAMFAERLQQAGLAIRPAEFIALHLFAVLASGAVAAFGSRSIVIGAIVVVLAAFLPLAWLDSAVRKRLDAFEEQLPDVLDLIAGSLRAGWGLQQALGLVVEQSLPPASVEFGRVQAEARLGIPVEQALEKMARRLQSEEFRWTVAAIAVQRDVGGNLAEVLDIVAKTMRERAQTRRQIKALTAEGRLSAAVLIALPFIELVALLVINPSYMSLLFTTPVGWAMSAIAVVLMSIGVVWLNRVMSVEV